MATSYSKLDPKAEKEVIKLGQLDGKDNPTTDASVVWGIREDSGSLPNGVPKHVRKCPAYEQAYWAYITAYQKAQISNT